MSRLETVLVADNDMNIRYFLKRRLSYLGYTVIIAANGQEVLSLFAKKQPDLVILDIMISKLDGYKVCKILRKNSRIPIILLTALANTTDHIRGLDLGADEYFTKPFLPEELETRIRSLLIRSYKIDYFNPLILQIGDLKLNTIKRHVLKDNKPVHLTLVEFNLLKLLMNKAGEILTRVTILDCIWGCTAYRYVDTRVVDVYISRLRSKLGQDSSAPNLILTIRGEGYKFQNVKN
jgi:OmpR family response regulator RpaB